MAAELFGLAVPARSSGPGVGAPTLSTKVTLRDRWHRLRVNALLAAQTGLAAALAWLLAHEVLGHPQPFFAPIAAVITLGVSIGQRLRRAAELVLGVAIGIAVGDAFIALVGTGAWQIGVVVTLAVLAAVFVGGTAPLLTQSASSAVLVATLAPPTTGIYYGRFIDALIGGVVALAVMALLLPVNPLTVVSRAAGPALDMLAEGLLDSAAALAARDPAAAGAALGDMRAGESDLTRFQDALGAGRETATLAPLRWRARGALSQYVDAAEHITHALRNARLLARRCVTLLQDAEPLPEPLIAAPATLAEAVRELRRELNDGVEPRHTRELAQRAVREAATAYADGVGFSGSVVVAQIRSIATDLLNATGLPSADANRLIRRAAHLPRTPSPARAKASPDKDAHGR